MVENGLEVNLAYLVESARRGWLRQIALDNARRPAHNRDMLTLESARSAAAFARGSRKRAPTSGALACAAVVALAALCGCGEDQYKPPVRKNLLADATPPPSVAAPAPIPIPSLPGGDLRADLGIASERYSGYSNRDLVDKADIFWKLYYMTKELQQGGTPRNLTAEFDALNARARKLHHDQNVAAIAVILNEVRTGLDARDLGQRLARHGVGVDSLPWTGGGYAIERALRAPERIHDGERSLSKVPTTEARRAADWATRHHASPAQVARESFSRAADLTNQLGDTLDDERRQAGESPIGRERVAPGAGLGNPYESMFPSRPVR
jgi:hypothetical protein